MSEDEYLKCPCKECGNNIEFPPSSARDTIACPHCGEWTELLLPEESPEPKARLNLAALALWVTLPMILLAGVVFLFRHRTDLAGFVENQPPPPSVTKVAVLPVMKPAPAPTNLSPATGAPTVAAIPAKPRAKSYQDLKVSEVKLEKATEGNLTFAVGTVKNDSDYQRFGVRIELDLISLQGAKIGTTQDYVSILEPHKEWHFRALVTEPKAVAVHVALLKEQE